MSNIFHKIVEEENFYKAYKKALRGGNKYTLEAIEFASNETYNLNKLRMSLIDESYQFSGYMRFKVYEPKERVIDAPHFNDKIVQLAINNVLKEVYQPCFIYDSYASLDNKGTHACVDRISYFMRKANWQYGEDAYIVKLDIKKFFYSIDRDILKEILTKKVKCQKTLNLLYKIIDSADSIDEKGLPLGNTLSQLFANIYLNEVDQYSKRKLGIKYYIRYMDDTIIIVENKEKAKEVKDLIIDFNNKKLNLRMNEKKSKIFPINQGVNAIGFKIHPTHRLLRNDSKKKIKKKAKKMKPLIETRRMTIEKAEQILNSWLGHSSHGDSHNFITKLINKNNHIYMNEKGVLKIDESKIEFLEEGDVVAIF